MGKIWLDKSIDEIEELYYEHIDGTIVSITPDDIIDEKYCVLSNLGLMDECGTRGDCIVELIFQKSKVEIVPTNAI